MSGLALARCLRTVLASRACCGPAPRLSSRKLQYHLQFLRRLYILKCLIHLSLEDVLNYFEAKGHAPESVSPKCSEVNRLFTQGHVPVYAFCLPYRKYFSIRQSWKDLFWGENDMMFNLNIAVAALRSSAFRRSVNLPFCLRL